MVTVFLKLLARGTKSSGQIYPLVHSERDSAIYLLYNLLIVTQTNKTLGERCWAVASFRPAADQEPVRDITLQRRLSAPLVGER